MMMVGMRRRRKEQGEEWDDFHEDHEHDDNAPALLSIFPLERTNNY